MRKIYSEEWMEEQGFFESNPESQQHIEYINETAKKGESYLTEFMRIKDH
jgi:hypothetical protein